MFNNLKLLSTQKRKQIAFGIAFSVCLVIFAVWAKNLPHTFDEKEVAKQDGKARDLSPAAALLGGFTSLSTTIKEKLQAVMDKTDTDYTDTEN
jgi:hypothetical protein